MVVSDFKKVFQAKHRQTQTKVFSMRRVEFLPNRHPYVGEVRFSLLTSQQLRWSLP